jgi:hypothetical protein
MEHINKVKLIFKELILREFYRMVYVANTHIYEVNNDCKSKIGEKYNVYKGYRIIDGVIKPSIPLIDQIVTNLQNGKINDTSLKILIYYLTIIYIEPICIHNFIRNICPWYQDYHIVLIPTVSCNLIQYNMNSMHKNMRRYISEGDDLITLDALFDIFKNKK